MKLKLEKASAKTLPPVSFRLSEEASFHLAVVAKVTKKKKAALIKEWISQTYEEAKRKWPDDLRKAEREVREKKK